jgi:hypothetical protein
MPFQFGRYVKSIDSDEFWNALHDHITLPDNVSREDEDKVRFAWNNLIQNIKEIAVEEYKKNER